MNFNSKYFSLFCICSGLLGDLRQYESFSNNPKFKVAKPYFKDNQGNKIAWGKNKDALYFYFIYILYMIQLDKNK